MPLCDPGNWKKRDKINDSIWSESPGRQAALAAQFPVGHVGAIGGQQAMFAEGGQPGGPLDPLPWVPDLVGKKSGDEYAIMIIGSAYAPFVSGFTGRLHSMPLGYYQDPVPQNWNKFSFRPTTGFLATVVGHAAPNELLVDDFSYYGKITAMLNQGFDLSRIILTDWCRASFVKRVAVAAGNVRPDCGGDPICGDEGAGVFFHYVEKNLDWHIRRIEGFKGKIILLGLLARRALEFLCHRQGWIIDYININNNIPVDRPLTIEGAKGFRDGVNHTAVGRIWITPKRNIRFTIVKHPSRQNGNYKLNMNF